MYEMAIVVDEFLRDANANPSGCVCVQPQRVATHNSYKNNRFIGHDESSTNKTNAIKNENKKNRPETAKQSNAQRKFQLEYDARTVATS